jgi:hypothetical protein
MRSCFCPPLFLSHLLLPCGLRPAYFPSYSIGSLTFFSLGGSCCSSTFFPSYLPVHPSFPATPMQFYATFFPSTVIAAMLLYNVYLLSIYCICCNAIPSFRLLYSLQCYTFFPSTVFAAMLYLLSVHCILCNVIPSFRLLYSLQCFILFPSTVFATMLQYCGERKIREPYMKKSANSYSN